MTKITCEDVVRWLKQRGLSTSAASIAMNLGTSSRAVATALRKATVDGRVTMRFPRRGPNRGIAFYRFVRLTPKAGT